MSDPFITEEELESFMEVTIDDSAASTLAIEAACTLVRQYLQQGINFVADDEILLDGSGTEWLRLPERPVREVTLVSVDGTEESPDNYFLRDSSLVRTDGIVWNPGKGNIEVTYSHGWDIELLSSDDYLELPADIKLVALCAARRIIDSMGEDSSPLQSESMGSYSYSTNNAAVPTEITKMEAAVLSRYKIRKVP